MYMEAPGRVAKPGRRSLQGPVAPALLPLLLALLPPLALLLELGPQVADVGAQVVQAGVDGHGVLVCERGTGGVWWSEKRGRLADSDRSERRVGDCHRRRWT